MTIPASSERKVIVPANGAKPVGPYSPGLLVGDYLYASGQGVRDANGIVPDGLKAQARQCLENVKAIVEAAGLTMKHVVHMQLYLEKMSDLPVVDGEKTVEAQVKVVMNKLQAALAAHRADFAQVVATNVYLDDIREFKPMNETYATFFSAAPPTRTTVQPFPVADRSTGDPALARISLVAVKE